MSFLIKSTLNYFKDMSKHLFIRIWCDSPLYTHIHIYMLHMYMPIIFNIYE